MATEYTFQKKIMPTETGGSKLINLFNGQMNDANHISIQAVGNGFMTVDKAGTKSPVVLGADGTATLETHDSAFRLLLNNTGADPVTISESTGEGTYSLTNGTSIELDVAAQATVLLASTSGTTVSFLYQII
jgi:hypothetical protein